MQSAFVIACAGLLSLGVNHCEAGCMRSQPAAQTASAANTVDAAGILQAPKSLVEMSAIAEEFAHVFEELDPALREEWEAVIKAREQDGFAWTEVRSKVVGDVLKNAKIRAVLQRLTEAARAPLWADWQAWRAYAASTPALVIHRGRGTLAMSNLLLMSIECNENISLVDYFSAGRRVVAYRLLAEGYPQISLRYPPLIAAIEKRWKTIGLAEGDAIAIEDLLRTAPWSMPARQAMIDMRDMAVVRVEACPVPDGSEESERKQVIGIINRFYEEALRFADRKGKDRFGMRSPNWGGMSDEDGDLVMKWDTLADVRTIPVIQMEVSVATMESALRVSIALARFKCAHKAWPIDLGQLAPEFLAEVPIDETSGDPFVYKASATDAAPMVYAVGSDWQDDGGAFDQDKNYTGLRGFRSPGYDYLVYAGEIECGK